MVGISQIPRPGRYFPASDQRMGMDMSKLGQQKEMKQFNVKQQEHLCAMNEEGKIHLEHLLLCGLRRDCGIPWSYRVKGWAAFPEKKSDHQKILLRRELGRKAHNV